MIKTIDIKRTREALRPRLTSRHIISKYSTEKDISSCLSGSNYKIKCFLPGHNEDDPSLSIGADSPVYQCFGGCNGDSSKGDFIKLIKVVECCNFIEAIKIACQMCGIKPIYEGEISSLPDVEPVRASPAKKSTEPRPNIQMSLTESMYANFVKSKDLFDAFVEKRGISAAYIKKYKLGVDFNGNYTIPIFKNGRLINIRYRRGLIGDADVAAKKIKLPKYWSYSIKDKDRKIIHAYGEASCFNVDDVKNHDGEYVIIVGGEYDSILLSQLGKEYGILAIGGSTGEKNWKEEWNDELSDYTIIVCMDNDKAGREATRDISKKIPGSRPVYIGRRGAKEGWDVSDYLNNLGIKDFVDRVINGVDDQLPADYDEDDIRPSADPNNDPAIKKYFRSISDSSQYPSTEAEALVRYAILHDTRDGIFDMAVGEYLHSGAIVKGISTMIKFVDDKGKTKGWKLDADARARRISSGNLVMSPGENVVWPKYNLFKGFKHADKKIPAADVRKAKAIIVKCLTGVCDGDAKLASWVLQWLAFPLQNPGTKMNTCVVAISNKVGVGKSVIFNKMMGTVYGEYYKPIMPHDIDSQFNNWIKGTLYCCGDDIASNEAIAYKISGPLRSLITENYTRWERKNIDSSTIRNYCNFAFTTNEKLPIVIKSDARRFCVIGTDKGKFMTEKEYDYIHNIAANNPALCLKVFLSIKCDKDIDKQDAPDSPLKTRLAKLSLPGTEAFVNSFKNGSLGVDPMNPFSVVKLMRIYSSWSKLCGRSTSNKDKLCEELMRHGFDKKGSSTFSGWCHADGNRKLKMSPFNDEFKTIMDKILDNEWEFDTENSGFSSKQGQNQHKSGQNLQESSDSRNDSGEIELPF